MFMVFTIINWVSSHEIKFFKCVFKNPELCLVNVAVCLNGCTCRTLAHEGRGGQMEAL